jgi:uncharacterized protein YdeI (YjbR/CyaY-like superfamily)
MNPKVDAYLKRAKKWQPEMARLRKILLACKLTEEFKWAKPCYTFEKSNLVIICELKESCALGFLKGALLKDAKGILIAPGENSQSMRWAKFTSVREIDGKSSTLKAYIREAIDAEKAGLKVVFKEKHDLVYPEEFQNKLDKIPALKTAFEALTPGRQRGYVLYFSGAKQSLTRASRVEKCTPQILNGIGLHDHFKPAKK